MVYFLSDAHIGSRALTNREEHQQRVVDLLEQMRADATQIFLLGDIFDFWYEYVWSVRDKEEYRPILDCLKRLTAQGIEVHFFTGNHDIWTFGWLARETGVQVHRESEVMTIEGRKCLLAHGDGLVPNDYMQTLPKRAQRRVRRFIRLRRVFHDPILQFLFRLLPPKVGNAFGYEWARRSREKELAHPHPYQGEAKEALVRYAKEYEPKCDYYIFGHRHIELDLQLADDSRVIILGEMFRQMTYARMENGEMRIENEYAYKRRTIGGI